MLKSKQTSQVFLALADVILCAVIIREPRRKHQFTGILLLVTILLLNLGTQVGVPSRLLAQNITYQSQDIPEEEIVFVDSEGYIRVWDPNISEDKNAVTWASKEGGYIDVALGDFNYDGDQEIAGIRIEGEQGKLVVYDPVLNSSVLTSDGEYNGIPWRTLYEMQIPGVPTMIDAGNLNSGVAGEEIIFGYENNGATTIVVLMGKKHEHQATEWAIHIDASFDFTWDAVAIGDANGLDTDEVVLIDHGSDSGDEISRLHIYRVDTSSLKQKSPIFVKESKDIQWRGAAIGEVSNDGPSEVIAYRSISGVDRPTAFFLQFQPHYELDTDKSFNENEQDSFIILNRPHWAFLADITGTTDNGQDDEVFFLREVKQEGSSQNRLIVKNRGTDLINIDKVSLALEQQSNWRRGEGGNIDGSTDGSEEVILLAANKLRIYQYTPYGERHLLEMATLENVVTNKKSLRIGDLDAIGFSTEVVLQIEPMNGPWEIQAGSQNVLMFRVIGPGNGIHVQVTVEQVQPWITNVTVGEDFTPSTSAISIDASDLLPGRYSIPVQITSTEPRIDYDALPVALEFDVTPAQIAVEPSTVHLVHFPCLDKVDPMQKVLTLAGASTIHYQAFVLTQSDFDTIQLSMKDSVHSVVANTAGGLSIANAQSYNHFLTDIRQQPRLDATGPITWTSPVWIEAVSAKGVINSTSYAITPSDTITITVDPAKLPTMHKTTSAQLMIAADRTTGTIPNNLLFIPIRFFCATARVHLPLLYPKGDSAGVTH